MLYSSIYSSMPSSSDAVHVLLRLLKTVTRESSYSKKRSTKIQYFWKINEKQTFLRNTSIQWIKCNARNGLNRLIEESKIQKLKQLWYVIFTFISIFTYNYKTVHYELTLNINYMRGWYCFVHIYTGQAPCSDAGQRGRSHRTDHQLRWRYERERGTSGLKRWAVIFWCSFIFNKNVLQNYTRD